MHALARHYERCGDRSDDTLRKSPHDLLATKVGTGGVKITTERLLLRSPRADDAPALFAFMGDPAAMRFTHLLPSLDACRRHIAVHENCRRTVGCAPWTIINKQTDEIIGWGGLHDDPFDPGWGVEVAYLFAPAVWGRGYATELVQCCLGIAEMHLQLDSVAAFAHPENAASRRVLEKTGFVEQEFLPAMHRYLYRRWL